MTVKREATARPRRDTLILVIELGYFEVNRHCSIKKSFLTNWKVNSTV